MSNVIHWIRRRIPAYYVERRDEAYHEYEVFCQRMRIRPPHKLQEQQRSTTQNNAMTDDDFVGKDAEIQTYEHSVDRQQQSYSQPINTNNITSGSEQHTTNSQYQNLLGLTPPDEIDVLFSDKRSNKNMPRSSIFYNDPSIKDNQDHIKRVSFYKSKLKGGSTIPKQTLSPIRKQKTSPVFKRNCTATQTPLNLRVQKMSMIDANDIERRLTKLEEEVPVVQNRVYQLLHGHMIEPDAYSAAERVSSPGSIMTSSSNTNSAPRTPSHSTVQNDMISPIHYYTPKSTGSAMGNNYISHSIYHHNNRSPNTPTSYKHITPLYTNHLELDITSLKKSLQPSKQHKSYMRRILYQMVHKELRKTDIIIDQNGELVPNPFWEEIYGEKYKHI
ncbi:hypothetical protein K501DRAFT_331564 [Backusella circina FSU 941]|nr:hypothetical protein K501DRAFT_331564 [Backusella circina FSU 941]